MRRLFDSIQTKTLIHRYTIFIHIFVLFINCVRLFTYIVFSYILFIQFILFAYSIDYYSLFKSHIYTWTWCIISYWKHTHIWTIFIHTFQLFIYYNHLFVFIIYQWKNSLLILIMSRLFLILTIQNNSCWSFSCFWWYQRWFSDLPGNYPEGYWIQQRTDTANNP